MRKTRRVVRVLAAVAIAAAVVSGVAWAAAVGTFENASTQTLKLGGTLTARPVGLQAQPRKAVPPRSPLLTATLFDSFTGATYGLTASTPRTFMGSPITPIDPLLTPIQITGGTLYMASVAAVSYTNIQANIQFYDTYASGSTPVYSGATGSIQAFSLGAVNTAAMTIYSIPVTFAAPITFAALTDRGYAVNYQGDTGTGLANTDNLTSVIRHTAAHAVGSSSQNGYYRNASGRTDFNFDSGDLRSLGAGYTNQGIAIILQGNATFPVGLQKMTAE